ncbi:MAG TPA: quinolinate synthase NadA [Bdellovibrionales bacterium]|nr:quinolinate synthase NadA [Bdellovibrionales bacterium]
METTVERIRRLKKERNALILAHFYEDGGIQDIADHVGDSLALAQWGEQAENPVIVLAGVVFMAESAKILSPDKTVLIPDLGAGCSLVDHSPYEKYLAWRREYPDAICVSYVNSSAAVKSITDVCCTSSNSEKIINAIPKDRRILFGPDRNLGRYLSKKLNREMILWPGACEVHILFSARKLFELKSAHPQAIVLAHPECDETVLQHADVIGATSRLLEEVTKSPAKEFIVATEIGIFHKMKQARPDAVLIQAPAQGSCACNECPYMKMNTLEKIANSLETLSPQIHVDSDLIERARVSLTRMLAISRGQTVHWPDKFDR